MGWIVGEKKIAVQENKRVKMRQRKGVSELDSSLGLGLNFSSIMFWNLEIIPICFPFSLNILMSEFRSSLTIKITDLASLTLSPSPMHTTILMWICTKMHNFRDKKTKQRNNFYFDFFFLG